MFNKYRFHQYVSRFETDELQPLTSELCFTANKTATTVRSRICAIKKAFSGRSTEAEYKTPYILASFLLHFIHTDIRHSMV